MENVNDILKEIEALSPTLATLKHLNVYTVPQGYFDYLTTDILSTLKIEEESFSQQNNYDVPVGYFDTLADNILAKVKQQNQNAIQETKLLSPLLSSVQHKNVYSLPNNYFETLNSELLNKVNSKVKIVSFSSRFKFAKYAAAAIFTGVIIFGIFKSTNKSMLLDEGTKKGIAMAQANSFENELNKLSDDDIVQYLQNNGDELDGSLLASVVDENAELTNEATINEENTADKYLDNLNLDDLKN